LDGYPSLDRIDLKILAILQEDGRITNQALAEKVALSPSACLARVRRLEADGLILGYHARLDVERIRPTVTVYGEVTLKSHRPADLLKFEAVLAQIPEVIEAAQVSGPFDYLIKVVSPDVPRLGRTRRLPASGGPGRRQDRVPHPDEGRQALSRRPGHRAQVGRAAAGLTRRPQRDPWPSSTRTLVPVTASDAGPTR
jgi:DNA-binding Lrp family transcriptional regulator